MRLESLEAVKLLLKHTNLQQVVGVGVGGRVESEREYVQDVNRHKEETAATN